MIAVDIETLDPNLHDLGPGANRQDGDILIVGLYDGKDYVGCKPDDPRLRDWLASDEEKVFHNGVYDLTWLICGKYHFKVGGTWHDTMTRCSLIDEYMNLDLDTCCKKFGVKGKNFDMTIEKWFDNVKKTWGLRGDFWKNVDVMMVMQPEMMYQKLAEYNKQDCIATYNLCVATEPFLRDVRECYEMECQLYPLWLQMRQNGIRFDRVRAERFLGIVKGLRDKAEQQLYYEYGINGEIIASPKKMTVAMNNLGIHSPNRTATGNESWDVKAMPIIEHPVVPMIMNFKNLDYIAGKKGIQKLLAADVDGRIYTTFSPNKRDDGGTITGRLGSAHPNLQNIGSREEAYGEKAWGPEARSLFLPEEGCMLGAVDYGQIEYRVMAHYAVGDHAEWFREQCRNGVDMHSLAMERTGIESRYIIKRINFGVPYGMGIKRMVNLDYPVFKKAATLHGDPDPWHYGEVLMQQFKTGFPVLFDMMASIENETRQIGYVTSLGGRRHHKPRPEMSVSGRWNVPYYRMTNYKIQGSAADILKRGLLDAYKAGVFDVLPMHLTVHDENVVSISYDKRGTEATQMLVNCMQSAYKERLTVPLTSSAEVGPNWGYWKSDIWDAMQQGDFNPDYFNKVYPPKVKSYFWAMKNGYTGLDGVVTMLEDEKFTQ